MDKSIIKVLKMVKSINFVKIKGPREVQPFGDKSKKFLHLSAENIVDHWIKFALGISWSLGLANTLPPFPSQPFLSNSPGFWVEWLTLGI